MEIDVYQLLQDNPLLLTFVVIGFGYLVGRIKIGTIELGPTTGVLLAGLLFGYLGFPDRPGAAVFGFTIFIFSVGLQAGPSFFSAFLADGRKYVLLAVVVALTAVGLALGLSQIVDLQYGLNAGLLAGALTSTPTLAGAKDAITSGLATLPAGMTAEQAADNISVAYAITYIFGTVGLILFIRYFPTIFDVDLPTEAVQFARQRGLGGRKRKTADMAASVPIIRAYRITHKDLVGKTIEQARADFGQRRGKPLRIRRAQEILDPEPGLKIQKGDVVSLIARLNDHMKARPLLGEEVLDPELLNYEIATHEIVVISPDIAGKPLKDLNVTSDYGCFVTGVTRAGIDLPADENTVLNKGDRLHVTGEEVRLQALGERIGHIEEKIEETDLLTFSLGICGGVLLGLVLVKIGGVSVGLGSAGGLLLMGIVIGFLRSVHPTFGRLPTPARYLLMELGLVLFMASVGLNAGGSIVDALTSVGPTLIVCGILVTLIPVVVGYAFGRYVLKLNPALLLGSLTGAMTSTASLNVVTRAARSAVPALGYAGTYTFANVLLTLAGTLMMTL